MSDALRKCGKREPLTWWRFRGLSVRVVCSRGHASFLQHNVAADGALVAPPGKASSCHCGVCNETLPIRLEGWTVEPAGDEEPLPVLARCDRCGLNSYDVSGWTSCAYGLVCPSCWKLLAAPPPAAMTTATKEPTDV